MTGKVVFINTYCLAIAYTYIEKILIIKDFKINTYQKNKCGCNLIITEE